MSIFSYSYDRTDFSSETVAKRYRNCSGAAPIALGSDDQHMQLWARARRELTWLRHGLATDLEICGQVPLRALPANRTIYLYAPYISSLWCIQVNRPIRGKCSQRDLPADFEVSRNPCRSQVNSVRARAQSCICWSSEPRAIGAAPEQLLTETVPFCDGFRRKIGPVVYKKSTKKGGAYFHQRKTAKIWPQVEDDGKNRLTS